MMQSPNPRLRLLIADDVHPVLMEMLVREGLKCDYRPDISREEALSIIGEYEGLILRSKFRVDRQMLEAGARLKFIGRAGAGMDNIDQATAISRGVALFSANEGNCDAVAEHMTGMLLALLTHTIRSDKQIRQGRWLREENRGVELGSRTVGLIGYGHNGKAMARKLSGFAPEVIAYDRYKSGFSDQYAQEVEMEEIFRRADILSLHIPLTEETRGMVDQRFIARFEKPLYFLNGSRGEIVDMTALADALEKGMVLGAGLDVLPVEKFPALLDFDWFSRLTQFENVLLTPHVAGWTVESYFKLSNVLASKILDFTKNSSV
jgi:D-3-phosphoglycerate dehydrogenase